MVVESLVMERYYEDEEPRKLVIVEREEFERSVSLDDKLHVHVGGGEHMMTSSQHEQQDEEMLDCSSSSTGSTDEGVAGLDTSSASVYGSSTHLISPSASSCTTGIGDVSDMSSNASAVSPSGCCLMSPDDSSSYLRQALCREAEAAETPAKKTKRRARNRMRLRWNNEQLKSMEHYFTAVNAYPSLGEYQALANLMAVSVKHVQIWFTNRRVKYKRLHRQKAVKNPLGKVVLSQNAASSLLGMSPLFNPTLLTTPVASGQIAGEGEVEDERSSYMPMRETVIPGNINPIEFVTSLPLSYNTRDMSDCASAFSKVGRQASKPTSRKLEKICSVVVRDEDDDIASDCQQASRYEAITPVPTDDDQPLDLSLHQPQTSFITPVKSREDAEVVTALLHLSGGAYNQPAALIYPHLAPSAHDLTYAHYQHQQYLAALACRGGVLQAMQG